MITILVYLMSILYSVMMVSAYGGLQGEFMLTITMLASGFFAMASGKCIRQMLADACVSMLLLFTLLFLGFPILGLLNLKLAIPVISFIIKIIFNVVFFVVGFIPYLVYLLSTKICALFLEGEMLEEMPYYIGFVAGMIEGRIVGGALAFKYGDRYPGRTIEVRHDDGTTDYIHMD